MRASTNSLKYLPQVSCELPRMLMFDPSIFYLQICAEMWNDITLHILVEEDLNSLLDLEDSHRICNL
jgi:hypothetical protein